MINYHGHTDMSNIRLLDSINSTEDLIYESVKLGHSGTAITDHEALGNHVKAVQMVKEGKKNGKIPEDYSLVLGNELYLVESREDVRDKYQGGGKTKFPHFLVLAKNRKGHEALRRLSSIAWENSFMAGGQRRVPTEKKDLEKMIKEYPDSLVMTTACLGSESSIHILNDEYDKAERFIEWCISLVGKDDFYLEIQPNVSDEQTKVNKKLIEYSHKYGLELIVTCDAHYLRPELFDIHSAYLNAKGGDRETSLFYADTYLHTEDEIREKLSYIDKESMDKAIMNTLKMKDKFEQYDLHNDTDIPRIVPDEFELNHTFKPAYDKFEYIKRAAYSDEEQDRYLLYLIEEGFLSKEPIKSITKEYFYKVMDRINKELGEILEISEILNQTMSSYYITMKKIIDIIWSSDECGGDSLVGGRGSVGAFYTAYLMSITEFNPLTSGLEIPHWRHLTASRPELPKYLGH